jgi:FkbM family methyltransferase
MWLDWDIALTILGNEIEIKKTYLSIINSPMRPDIFIDIGANYGYHSLLFLANNIESIYFEPNKNCHEYFNNLCKINHCRPRIEEIALGEKRGWVNLIFPEHDTWLGSTNVNIVSRIGTSDNILSFFVQQCTLDDFLDELINKRILIKIDAEGSEFDIIKGSINILKKCRPYIIFESWNNATADTNDRRDLFNFFTAFNYKINKLPADFISNAIQVSIDQFIRSNDINFLANPN